MKRKHLFILLSLLSTSLHAQFIPMGWNIQAKVFRSSAESYKLDVKDGPRVAEGDIDSRVRALTSISYTFKVNRMISIGASSRYEYNNETLMGLPKDIVPWKDDHHTYKGGLNAICTLPLWHKPLIVFASASANASPWGIERFNGFAAAMLMLTTTKTTQLGLACIALINTTSKMPVIPFAFYRHMFSSQWTLNLTYPFFGMQFTPSPRHTLAAGFTVDTYNYWLHTDAATLPHTVFYRRSLVKTGLNYDFRISPNFTLTAQSGWEMTMKGGIYTSSGHRQLYEMNRPQGFYSHIGIAYRSKAKPAAPHGNSQPQLTRP